MFEDALRFVLRWEGGYSNHPDDPGGATNYGVTQLTYDAYRRRRGLPFKPVRDITMDEVRDIYRSMYWDPSGGDELPPPLALATFDAAVNSGVGRALQWLAAANGDWRRLVAIRLEYLAGLSIWVTFGRGWARRISALIQACAELEPSVSRARRVVVLGMGDEKPRGINQISLVDDKLYVRVREERK